MKNLLLFCILLLTQIGFGQSFDEYTKEWGTYFGGQGTRFVNGLVDSEDNIIALAEIMGPIHDVIIDEEYYNSFLTTNDPQFLYDSTLVGVSGTDARQTLIAKFSPEGELLQSVYLPFAPWKTRIDQDDNLYMLGTTKSDSLGTAGTWQSTPFNDSESKKIMAKLNSDFSLDWLSYLPVFQPGDFCLDENATIYGVGNTKITSGITTPDAYQSDYLTYYDPHGEVYRNGYLYKLTSNGQLEWATYYGAGTEGKAIAYNGNELIASFIGASQLPEDDEDFYTPGAYQETPTGQVISKFNAATGGRTYSTYISDISIQSIISADRNYYFLGTVIQSVTDENLLQNAYQSDFGGLWDTFLLNFDVDMQPVWGTYIGGEEIEIFEGYNDLVFKDDHLYFSGYTASEDFINSENTYQAEPNSSSEQFMMKFSTEGELVWGSYFGGSDMEPYSYVAPVNDSIFYWVGSTYSEDHISTVDSYQEEISYHPEYSYVANQGNGFIAKFAPEKDLSIPGNSKNDFIVYPNPATDHLVLENINLEGKKQVIIYNMLGQQVFQQNLEEAEKYILSIDFLSKGIYHLEVNNNISKIHKKIIVN